jgi:hypothetical protein
MRWENYSKLFVGDGMDQGSTKEDVDHSDHYSSSHNPVYMLDSLDTVSPRMSTVGLLHCYENMLKQIPENLHGFVQLQV